MFNDGASEQLKQALLRALEDACYIVENKAKEGCPVDSGTLRRSIGHQVDESDFIGTIGTNVEYACTVHEGHGSYAGVPFLEDALNSSVTEIQNCFRDIL